MNKKDNNLQYCDCADEWNDDYELSEEDLANLDEEINLDIEWSRAMADLLELGYIDIIDDEND